MAKEKQQQPGSPAVVGEPDRPVEQGKTAEQSNPGGLTQGWPESPRTAQERPTGHNGGGPVPPPDEPREKTRKPRQHQELTQLVMSDEIQRRIAASLPKHITPERWISVLLTINSGSPELQKCDPRSILAAALQGAVLGLDFNKQLREAYLIPRSYEKSGPDGRPLRDASGRIMKFYEATFMPGYAGLRKLVMNGGDVVNVRSALVYESELTASNGAFVYQFSPDLEFLHRPCLDARQRGDLKLAYAYAKLKSGEPVLEVMTIDEVEKSGHQRSSIYQASLRPGGVESGPWVNDYEMMVRKTVLKRLCNQLPMSADVAQAITLDNMGYVSSVDRPGQHPGRRAIEVARRGRGAQTLADRLGDLDPDDDGDNHADGSQETLDEDAAVVDTGAGEDS